MAKATLVAVAATLVSFVLADTLSAQGQTWYVSAARGKGKKGTKEEPAKDLGTIASQVKAGDTICVAAGNYLGKSECGVDKFEVPVRILGGFSDDFSTRDPWGQHKTVLSGDNKNKNFDGAARLTINASSAKAGDEVLVDGVLIDNGGRNHYDKDKGLKIVRMANPTTGANATPDTQGIHVLLGEGSKCTIQNCVVTNCAPSGLTGAIHVHAMEKCTTTIRNNLVANNTGTGIQLTYGGAAKEGPTLPQFTVNENSILFCWLFEPSASHGGSALKMDGGAVVNAASNVFAFCDQYAVDNARRSKGLTLKDNLFGSCGLADYLEFGTKIAFKDLEDNAECLAKETGGNVQNKLELNLDPQWAVGFAARTLVDRAKAEAGSKVENTVENQLRAMFGMNLKGTAVDLSSEVWLHRIKLEHAIACGSQKQSGKFGCQSPSAATAPAQPGR